MESKRFSFNAQKAHQLNFKITCFMVALIAISNSASQGFAESKLYILAGIGVIGCACFIYFMKLPYMAKAVLFALIPATVVFALFFLDGYTLNKHYLFFITFVMAAIYFDRKILIAFGLVMDLYVVLLYILAADKFLGENSSFLNFITVFCVYNGIMYMLNKLNEWGGDLVSESQKGEQEASHLLQETKELVALIEHSAHTLGAETDDVKNTSNLSKTK